MKNAHKHLIRNPQGKKAHKRYTCVDDKIIFKWILTYIECEDVDWTQLSQDKVQKWIFVTMAINHQILYKQATS